MVAEFINNISMEVVLVIILIAVILLIPRVTALVLKALLRGAFGAGIIFVVNFLLNPFGVFVGINIVTFLLVAILGIPGIISLYILQFLI